MSVLASKLDTSTPQYLADRESMLGALAGLADLSRTVVAAGSDKAVSRHRDRGKLLARERVDLLLDEDTPLLELSSFAGAHESEEHPGARLITGIGQVSGVECVIIANESTVKGGSLSPSAVAKQLRALDIAERNRLPVVSLVESGGADLPQQADIFVPGGRTFRELTRLSAAGIPTIALVFGSSTAGGAYIPGMSEYTVFVEGAAAVYLGGPPLVKMATGEDIDDEALGGADMHARVSGLADYLAVDERDALRIGRQIVADLGWHKAGPEPTLSPDMPVLPADELLGVASSDPKRPMDVREVLARVLDGSRFNEFKPLYGRQLVCGWGSLAGYPVGVLANNGILFSAESQKASHFIQLANARNIPLLFVQNITGFMVGSAAERGGIIKDGAKLINAVSNSKVPHLTLMVGASYGAGNYGMSGRSYDPRFVFTWPNHRIAVMGGPQLAGVMSIISRRAAERANRPYDEDMDLQIRQRTEQMIDEQSSAVYATGRLWDDGVIDPRHTRTVLGLALSAVHSGPIEGATHFAPFRM
ncbi:acetyl-CoA carboxylase carboxyltransferase subunit [Pseudarthrobacter sulfonivorans]|uniref:Acetyl-CoA carboxylase carboxyltransferase subunit n=1 Tax=Pseudarthrobacter sulfonivorans TaxID=121292 RepID=A0A0U3Q3R9_9MICC|nr:carboxyl transferase domain-containing protein [Pseudarthrobacter sulfonivorans]ALV39882.1 acetyl-CoA carboxylase carboxyltransferase subunit [Pseudarthrobacter sulfonivorans]